MTPQLLFLQLKPSPNEDIPRPRSNRASFNHMKKCSISIKLTAKSPNINRKGTKNLPNGHQETENKHGEATSQTFLFIIRDFYGPKPSSNNISNSYIENSQKKRSTKGTNHRLSNMSFSCYHPHHTSLLTKLLQPVTHAKREVHSKLTLEHNIEAL